ncbi:hypothetical protein ASZ90_019895 [hydrocarbon metagenome]|uniref:Uncharacterized protein n=1 Tax=hydrocarbon metagenome TaxID=938273 RepID=A0A0W8E246_9ZZZZ
MSRLFTTGPVENGVGNPALTALVKVLNNRTTDTLTARIALYNLEGVKEQISTVTLTVPALSSDFTTSQVDFLKEYEIQIEVDKDEGALISVWALDSEANLIAAQRFVHTELKEYPIPAAKIRRFRMPTKKNRKRSRR